jgi:hypothetical protein
VRGCERRDKDLLKEPANNSPLKHKHHTQTPPPATTDPTMASSLNAKEPAASSSSQDEPTIRIKIMSPSPEVPPDLSYTIRPSTTIIALKRMIRESLPSLPTLDRQRLIFRGKVLLGQLTIREMLVGVEVSSLNSTRNNR